MSTYISLINYTRDGIAAIKDSPKRLSVVKTIGLENGRQIEGQGPAMFVTQGMDLGVSAAFGAADGLSRSPPFPPPAQRCALTKVVSMETCSGVSARVSVKARNRYCQWPRPDQRL